MQPPQPNDPDYATYSKLRGMYDNVGTLNGGIRHAIGQLFKEMMKSVDGVRIAAIVFNPCFGIGPNEATLAFKLLGRALRSRAEGSSEFRAEIARTVFPQLFAALLLPPMDVFKDIMPVALSFVRLFSGFKLRGRNWSYHGIVPQNNWDVEFENMVYEEMQRREQQNETQQRQNVQLNNSSLENTTRKRSSKLLADNNTRDEIFSVRHSKSVRLDFDELWKSKKFCDLEFKCSDGHVNAHKCILSARSEIFRAMLDDEGRNSNLRKLEAEDTTVAEMKSLLKYVYTGSVKLTNGENVISLIKLADKYQLHQLRADGFDFLVKKMNLTNAGQLVKLAYNHQAPDEVKLKIQEYVISMRAELAEVPEYQEIVGENPAALTTLMLGKFTKD